MALPTVRVTVAPDDTAVYPSENTSVKSPEGFLSIVPVITVPFEVTTKVMDSTNVPLYAADCSASAMPSTRLSLSSVPSIVTPVPEPFSLMTSTASDLPTAIVTSPVRSRVDSPSTAAMASASPYSKLTVTPPDVRTLSLLVLVSAKTLRVPESGLSGTAFSMKSR